MVELHYSEKRAAEGIGPAMRRATEGVLSPDGAPSTTEATAKVIVGPVLRKATQTAARHVKRAGKVGIGSKNKKNNGCLTKKHPSIRHLLACEHLHGWHWVPDSRLSSLWRRLSPPERALVVSTHDSGQPTKRFLKDLGPHLQERACHARDSAKEQLASMILRDQGSLLLYKEIFIAAVEENLPLAIDMDVIVAVDGVVQDYCATRAARGQQVERCAAGLVALLLFTCAWFLVTGGFFWAAHVLIGVLAVVSVWMFCLPQHLDPRTFPEGSDLWVQYREREHVRLLWMSAMARVFEVRLLQIWEAQRTANTNAVGRSVSLESGASANLEENAQESVVQTPSTSQSPAEDNEVELEPAKLDCCAQMSLMRAEEALVVRGQSGEANEASRGSGVPLRQRRKRQRTPRKAEIQEVTDNTEFDGELCDTAEVSEIGGGDEIDAEFRRRVLEHLQKRKAASKGSETERGNQILKSLCETLKVQLEQARTVKATC